MSSNLKPKLYFTADWHLGHENCLTLDGRPFADLNAMHAGLIKNFNMTVPEHGITYFLGDMGLCKGSIIGDVVKQLNGTKILIMGNHDNKGMYSYYQAGFDVVIDKAQIRIGKNILTMSHCPLKGVYREDTTGMNGTAPGENWHKERFHKDIYSFEDFGQFHAHGHIHSPNCGKSQRTLLRQIDVGVPANAYSPVSLSKIESWIAKTLKEEENGKKSK